MAKGQKSRTKKESKGIHGGAKKSPQTPLALVLMGKGLFAQTKRL